MSLILLSVNNFKRGKKKEKHLVLFRPEHLSFCVWQFGILGIKELTEITSVLEPYNILILPHESKQHVCLL